MKKMVEWFGRVCERKYFPIIFLPLAFLFLGIFSWSTSPLFINEGADSAVFKTMGQALLQGKVIYRDIFDHKGPYLYFINALGQWLIPGRTGIFVLQVAACSTALWYLFRTAKLFLKSSSALICVVLSLVFFGGHILEGNQCEEWMMYVVCIAFYYACSYFVNKHEEDHPPLYAFLYGLCFGFSFFIRPNDAVAWVGGIMSGLVVWLFYRKRYKNALINGLCFFCGFSVMALPVLIYFGYHGAISDMWYGLIGFNHEYSGGLIFLLRTCFTKSKLFLLLLFALFVWLVYDTKYERVLFFVSPAFLFAVLLMGNNMFLHYLICFVPFWLLFFTFFMVKSRRTYWTIAIFCFLLHYSQIYKGEFWINPSVMKWNTTGQRAVYNQAESLLSLIPESQKDSIWNYNLHWEAYSKDKWQSEFSVYCYFGIVPCNKVTRGINDRLEKEDDISQRNPKWILYQQKRRDISWNERKNFTADSIFIASHYDMIAQTDTAICKLRLYKRR